MVSSDNLDMLLKLPNVTCLTNLFLQHGGSATLGNCRALMPVSLWQRTHQTHGSKGANLGWWREAQKALGQAQESFDKLLLRVWGVGNRVCDPVVYLCDPRRVGIPNAGALHRRRFLDHNVHPAPRSEPRQLHQDIYTALSYCAGYLAGVLVRNSHPLIRQCLEALSLRVSPA